MINMVEGVRNLIQQVGIEEGEALRMAALYPALLMNRVGVSGKIEEGELLNGVMLDENWNVLDVFRAH
jgi:N-acetylglucosamine-6-phosphate deacetylase